MMRAQEQQYLVGEDAKMTITGTSTIHDWTSDVTEVRGSMTLDGKLLTRGSIKKGDKIKALSITVPVKSIISPRGATMDKKTYAALKSEGHPNIIFALDDNKVSSVEGGKFVITAKGDLSMAGVTQRIEMEVEGKKTDEKGYWFKGNKKLNMKDYDMEPPSAMFGQIVTGEEVEINFEVVFNVQ